MSDKFQLISPSKEATVNIDAGGLTGYLFEGTEIMHQKGSPGWGNTEIEMFPNIGATAENNYSVATAKGDAKLDQHGIARALEYELFESEPERIQFKKTYRAGRTIVNPKFPKKSTLELMTWPYDFELIKTFELSDEALSVQYRIVAEKGMPFMLGFHPAFKLYNEDLSFRVGSEKFQLEDVMEVGSSAFLQDGVQEIYLENNGALDLKLTTTGFKHFMLWTEVKNMVCVEPITHYPASLPQKRMHEGFDLLRGDEFFEMSIAPKKASEAIS